MIMFRYKHIIPQLLFCCRPVIPLIKFRMKRAFQPLKPTVFLNTSKCWHPTEASRDANHLRQAKQNHSLPATGNSLTPDWKANYLGMPMAEPCGTLIRSCRCNRQRKFYVERIWWLCTVDWQINSIVVSTTMELVFTGYGVVAPSMAGMITKGLM